MINISLYEDLIRERNRPLTRAERERVDLLRELEKARSASRSAALRRWLRSRLGMYYPSRWSNDGADREPGGDTVLTVS